MRRMLSATVIVHTAPTQAQLLLADGAATIGLYTPTETEMRNAIALATKELDDMYVARGYSGSGWAVANYDFKTVLSPEKDVLLMGAMIIRRDN